MLCWRSRIPQNSSQNLSIWDFISPWIGQMLCKEDSCDCLESMEVIGTSSAPQTQTHLNQFYLKSQPHPDFKGAIQPLFQLMKSCCEMCVGMFLPFLSYSRRKNPRLQLSVFSVEFCSCCVFPFAHTCTHWYRLGVSQYLWLAWKSQWSGAWLGSSGWFFEMFVWASFKSHVYSCTELP